MVHPAAAGEPSAAVSPPAPGPLETQRHPDGDENDVQKKTQVDNDSLNAVTTLEQQLVAVTTECSKDEQDDAEKKEQLLAEEEPPCCSPKQQQKHVEGLMEVEATPSRKRCVLDVKSSSNNSCMILSSPQRQPQDHPQGCSATSPTLTVPSDGSTTTAASTVSHFETTTTQQAHKRRKSNERRAPKTSTSTHSSSSSSSSATSSAANSEDETTANCGGEDDKSDNTGGAVSAAVSERLSEISITATEQRELQPEEQQRQPEQVESAENRRQRPQEQQQQQQQDDATTATANATATGAATTTTNTATSAYDRETATCLRYIRARQLENGLYRSAMKFCHDALQQLYRQVYEWVALQKQHRGGTSGAAGRQQIQEYRDRITAAWCLYAAVLVHVGAMERQQRQQQQATTSLSLHGSSSSVGTATSTSSGRDEDEERALTDDWRDYALATLSSTTHCPLVGNHENIAIAIARALVGNNILSYQHQHRDNHDQQHPPGPRRRRPRPEDVRNALNACKDGIRRAQSSSRHRHHRQASYAPIPLNDMDFFRMARHEIKVPAAAAAGRQPHPHVVDPVSVVELQASLETIADLPQLLEPATQQYFWFNHSSNSTSSRSNKAGIQAIWAEMNRIQPAAVPLKQPSKPAAATTAKPPAAPTAPTASRTSATVPSKQAMIVEPSQGATTVTAVSAAVAADDSTASTASSSTTTLCSSSSLSSKATSSSSSSIVEMEEEEEEVGPKQQQEQRPMSALVVKYDASSSSSNNPATAAPGL